MRKILFDFLVLFVLALITSACAKDDLVGSEEVFDGVNDKVSDVRSLEDALAYADDWFVQMDSLSNTRSKVRRVVSSVKVLSSNERTRSGMPDTLLYLVNYDYNKGFALLGAQSSSEDIYAISEEGSLELSDTVFNEGLKIFIENAESHAMNSLYSGSFDVTYIYHIKRKGGIMLHENVTKWNQTAPFNKYSYTDDGRQGVVGCGPVATGMLMAHYKYPNSIDGKKIDWNAIIEQNDYDKIADLLETLAGPNYLASYYKSGPSSRSTPSANFFPTFKKCGYDMTNAWNFYSFHSNRKLVFDFMYSGIAGVLSNAPLIFYGQSATGAHVWIADAFIERVKTPGNSNISSEADPMIHMVWGWGGRGNGYYLYLLDDMHLETSNSDGVSIPYQYGSLSVIGRVASGN